MEKIGVIFGGNSGEHEVSLMSAAAVISAIDKSKYEIVRIGITKEGKWLRYDGPVDKIPSGEWSRDGKELNVWNLNNIIDFAFPVLHGSCGEDGTMQGLLEIMDIPYAGCGVLASALCMDKAAAKDIFELNGIKTCKYMLVYAAEVDKDADFVAEDIEKRIPGAVFIKPSNMGSSIGISKAKGREEIVKALRLAASYDRRIIVEQAVTAREIEVAVIGNEYPQAADPGEIIAASEYYDYESKYTDGSGTLLEIPAHLEPELKQKIKDLAVKAYRAADCAGFSRVDFFVDRRTDEVLINEINTIPGFTKYSMFPILWENSGIGFTELIERIVEFGYERYNDKNNRKAFRG